MVDGSFSVQTTAVSKAARLQQMTVGQRQRAMLVYLFNYRVRRLDEAFVPVRVLAYQASNFFAVQLLIFVKVTSLYQTLPKLVLVYGASGYGRGQ